MNKRIQELAEQAGFNLHNDPIDGHDNTHEINKFAQSIVQECARLNKDQSHELMGVIADVEEGDGFES